MTFGIDYQGSTVIVAGDAHSRRARRGPRDPIRDFTGGLPKAMLPVRATLHRPQAGEARGVGVKEVVLLLGHSDDKSATTWDGGQLGLAVSYVEDGRRSGVRAERSCTAGALPSSFWVTYGDTLLTSTSRRPEQPSTRAGCRALMTVLHNRDDVATEQRGRRGGYVVDYERAPAGAEYLDYG